MILANRQRRLHECASVRCPQLNVLFHNTRTKCVIPQHTSAVSSLVCSSAYRVITRSVNVNVLFCRQSPHNAIREWKNFVTSGVSQTINSLSRLNGERVQKRRGIARNQWTICCQLTSRGPSVVAAGTIFGGVR